MLDNGEASLLGDLVLTALDLRIGELLDVAALHADQMIVMLAVVEFEYRLAGFEVVPFEQADLFELGQDAVNSRQPDVEVIGQQLSIDVFRGEVARRRLPEQVKDGHARHGGLEADALEFCRIGHGGEGEERENPYDIVFRVPDALHSPPAMLLRTISILSLPLLAACSGTPDVGSMLSPYRIDVRQGNYVSQEMVAKLRPGMTRDQVRFVLGTPLVADMFHAERWDYVYRFQPGRGEPQLRRLVVYFDDDKLARVGGDVVAASEDAPLEPPSATARIIEVPDPKKKD